MLAIGLTQRLGYMRSCDLKAEYAACSIEDHDITPLDFVFEHLLNLESIVNILEGEHDYTNGDHPHQPLEATSSVILIAVGVPQTFRYSFIEEHFFIDDSLTYPLRRGDFYCSHFYTDILRPPILS